jgi:hypothetical protein
MPGRNKLEFMTVWNPEFDWQSFFVLRKDIIRRAAVDEITRRYYVFP